MVAWLAGAARAVGEDAKGLSVSKIKDVNMGSAVMQVRFSTDGKMLAAACRTGLQLWCLGEDKLPREIARAAVGDEGGPPIGLTSLGRPFRLMAAPLG